MRGEVVILRARLLALIACFVAAVALPASGVGSSGSLREQAQQLTQENSVLASRSRAAVLTLYGLDSQLARAQAQLSALRAKAAELSRQRAQTRVNLRIARRTFTIAQRHLADRLRSLYEHGDSDPLSIVLGARTLDDAVSGIETVNASAATDRSVVAQARAGRTALTRLTRKLAARAERLSRLRARVAGSVQALAAARAERVAYVQQIAAQRRLNTSQISSLESQAAAIEARAREIAVQQAATPVASSASAPVAGPIAADGRTMTVVATAYTLGGTTATGAPVGYGVVAVDPNVIPLGTRLSIPGYGAGVASDTGAAIQGARIDLWFPSAAAAAAWGSRAVTISLH